MQKHYQKAADQLQKTVEEVVTTLRKEMHDEGLNLDQIAKQPMMVEIVSFLLVKCLSDERLTFAAFKDEQQARREAMEIVKAAVIQYRGKNLEPPLKKYQAPF